MSLDSEDVDSLLDLSFLTNQPTPQELCESGNFTQLFSLYELVNKHQLKLKGYQATDYFDTERQSVVLSDLHKSRDSNSCKVCKVSYQPIHYAAAYGNLKAVRMLVEKYGCPPDSCISGNHTVYCDTPAYIACGYGYHDVTKYLVRYCSMSQLDSSRMLALACWPAVARANHQVSLYATDFTCLPPVDFKYDFDYFIRCNDRIKIIKLVLEQIKPVEVNAFLILCLFLFCGGSNELEYLKKKIGKKDFRMLLNSYLIVLLNFAVYNNENNLIKHLIEMLDINTTVIQQALYLFYLLYQREESIVYQLLADELIRTINGPADAIYSISDRAFSLLIEACDYCEPFKLIHFFIMHGSLEGKLQLSLTCLVNKFGDCIDSKNGQNLLHYACKNKNIEVAEYLQKEKPSLQCMDDLNGKLPLHIVCDYDDYDYKALQDKMLHAVSSACDVDFRDKSGSTPLHIACSRSNWECIEYLIFVKKALKSLTFKNDAKEIPLHFIFKSLKTAKQPLYLQCIDQNSIITESIAQQCDENGDTLLHIACTHYRKPIIKYLLSISRSLIWKQNIKDRRLPIHSFVHMLCYIMPEKVIDHDDVINIFDVLCDSKTVNFPDSKGNTILHILCDLYHRCYYSHDNFWGVLIKKVVYANKATIKIPNDSLCLPLHHIVPVIFPFVHQLNDKLIEGGLFSLLVNDSLQLQDIIKHKFSEQAFFEILNILSTSYTTRAQDKLGNTALHLACQIDGIVNPLISFLVDKCHCCVDVFNKKLNLPIHVHMSCEGRISKHNLELLLNDTSINYPNQDCNTPLHLACMKCSHHKLVPFLVKIKGALTVVQNLKHELPLHLILKAFCKCFYTVDMLISDTVLLVEDEAGNIPLHIACDHSKCHSFNEVVLLLITVNYSLLQRSGNYQLLALRTNALDQLCARNKQNKTPLQIFLDTYTCYDYHKDKHFHVFCSTLLHALSVGPEKERICEDLRLHLWSSNMMKWDYLSRKFGLLILEALMNDNTIHTCDDQGQTILHVAFKKGSSNVIFQCSQGSLCQDYSASDVWNLVDAGGNLPLHYASKQSLDLVKLLPISNENMHSYNKEDLAPLHIAIKSKKYEIVEYLYKKHEDLCDLSITECRMANDIFNHVREATLCNCDFIHVFSGLLDKSTVNHRLLNFFADKRLSIEDVASKHQIDFALWLTCNIGFVETGINDDFISNKCSINCLPFTAINKTSLLYAAAWCGRIDILHYLIEEQECDVQETDANRSNALVYACRLSSPYSPFFINEPDKVPSVDSINLLIENGCSPFDEFTHDYRNTTIMALVCKKADIHLFKAITSSYHTVNAQDKKGNTPLMILLQQNVSDFDFILKGCKYLIEERHCDQNLTNYEKSTALYIACQNDALLEVVRIMDLSVNVKNSREYTPFEVACRCGSLNIVEYIVKKNQPNNDQKMGLLKIAWNHGSTAVANFFLNNLPLPYILSDKNIPEALVQFAVYHECERANPHNASCIYPFGDTLLHLACKYRYMENKVNSVMVTATDLPSLNLNRMLHVQLDSQNEVKDTPLHIACSRGDFETVSFFLDQGHDAVKKSLILKNFNGDLPLHVALKSFEIDETTPTRLVCLFKLVQMTVAIDDLPLSNVLHKVCHSGNNHYQKIAKYLVNKRCEYIFSTDHFNSLPLHYASSVSLDLVKLCASKDNVNIQKENGSTPLHIACDSEQISICRFLVEEMECEVNSCDIEGLTPLHIACLRGNYFVCELFLNHASAKWTLKDNSKQTPFHKVCALSKNVTKIASLFSIKKILESCTADNDGDYPLHILCKEFRNEKLDLFVKLVRILNEHKKLDTVLKTNHDGKMPFHYLCQSITEGNSCDAVKILLSFNKAYLNFKTKPIGDTPLHLAVRSRRHDIIEVLVKNGADITIVNAKMENPLHLACSLDMMTPIKCISEEPQLQFSQDSQVTENDDYYSDQLLNIKRTLEYLKSKKDTLCAQTYEGDTPLHIFLTNDHYLDDDLRDRGLDFFEMENLHFELFQLIITPHDIIPNNKGEYVIHLACQHQSLEIIKMVNITGIHEKTKDGDNILHYVCRGRSSYVSEIFDYLASVIPESNLDILLHEANDDGDLPLHVLFRSSCIDANIEFMKEKQCNFLQCNNYGESPFAWFVSHHRVRHSPILKAMLQDNYKALTMPNNGVTPLDLIARNKNHALANEIISIFESEKLKDILTSACDDFIQMILLHYPERAKMLFGFGINPAPLYESHTKFFQGNMETKIPINMLSIGDSNTGKTTLINSLQEEAKHSASLQVKTGYCVKATEHMASLQEEAGHCERMTKHTAGIVSETYESRKYGKVTSYDFAGQREYYAGHDAVMQSIIQNIPPIVLLHVNLKMRIEEITKRIIYWSNFIRNRLSRVNQNANLVIVCSHRDEVDDLEADKRIKDIKSNQTFNQTCFKLISVIGMDCRSSRSNEIAHLVDMLTVTCTELRQKGVLDFEAHCLYVYLSQHLKDYPAITVNTLFHKRHELHIKLGKEFKIIPDSLRELTKLCKKLASNGLIMLINDRIHPHQNWIILDKAVLLNEVSGKLFAPSDFSIHDRTLSISGTGIIAFSKIKSTFPQYDPGMITAFLSAIEYCYEVRNERVIKSILKHSLENLPDNDTYYFFPGLVTIERPKIIWNCREKSFTFAWVLKCEDPKNLFSPKFIQTLILYLIFHSTKIVYKGYEIGVSSISKVWKSGLYWFDKNNLDTLVDVVDTASKVIMFMRCEPDKEMQLLKHRSNLINLIRSLHKEICPSVTVGEYFIDQSHVNECFTTVEADNRFLVPIKSICDAIKEAEEAEECHILTMYNNCNPRLSEIILFDPYSYLCDLLVQRILNKDYQDLPVTNSFLTALTNHLHKKYELFSKLLMIPPLKLATLPSDERCIKFLHILKSWRNDQNGTYGSLKKLFNSISIFSEEVSEIPCSNKCQYRVCRDSISIDAIPSLPHTRLYEADLARICEKLGPYAYKWKEIALGLHFDVHELRNIEANPLHLPGAPLSYLREMLSSWLQWAPEDARGSTGYANQESLKRALGETDLSPDIMT